MPLSTPVSPGWCIVTEWEDGTVAVTACVSSIGNGLVTNPTVDELQSAAWRTACVVEGEFDENDVLDVDKTRIHNLCGASDDPESIRFRVSDDPDGDGHDVYVQRMGRVEVR